MSTSRSSRRSGARIPPLHRLGPIVVIAFGMAVALGAYHDAAGPGRPTVDGRGQFTFDVRAQAQDGAVGSSCSIGDARALLETLLVANEILERDGLDQPWAQTLIRCQYRLFWQAGHPILGTPLTYSPQDFILGGTAFRVPYKLLGMTGQEGAAILDAIDVRIWLAAVTEAGIGDLVEQTVMTSSLKQTLTGDLGLILWRQWGFISQLPPGEYFTVTQVTRPIFFEDQFLWTVSIHIE